MPKPAFFNLSENKRNLIISVSINEFSSANYDNASINQICKKSNMAKGSFYQYFEDKLDLYIYIMTLAIENKIIYFSQTLNNFKSLTLQEQIRLLFIKGIEFAEKYPQYAALGERFSKESNESAKSAIIKKGDTQSEVLFVQMIENAKLKEEIRNNVDTLALSMMLQSVYKTVVEYMLNEFGSADYISHSNNINKLVDSLLSIILNGINPN